jgi:hypothetical protein
MHEQSYSAKGDLFLTQIDHIPPFFMFYLLISLLLIKRAYQTCINSVGKMQFLFGFWSQVHLQSEKF